MFVSSTSRRVYTVGTIHCVFGSVATSCCSSIVHMTPAKKPTTGQVDVGEKKKEYKYQQEISQMVCSQVWSIIMAAPLNYFVYRCSFSVRSKNRSQKRSILWRASLKVNS